MNDKKKEMSKYENLEQQQLREPLRPRSNCAGEIRHHRECACGRLRTIIRHGHRWRRLGTCLHCLVYKLPASGASNSNITGGSSHG